MNDPNIKARTLLSKYIKEIADENTEAATDGQMMTKAEALARWVWKAALGYTDENDKVHGPDKTCVNIILDRMEGKAAMGTEKDKGQKASLADRVSEQATKRLNVLAGG